MVIASAQTIANVTGQVPYASGYTHDEGAARVNLALVRATGGKMPCYAIPGKRRGYIWVSIGSSAVIPRGMATEWIKRVGADINEVEAA